MNSMSPYANVRMSTADISDAIVKMLLKNEADEYRAEVLRYEIKAFDDSVRNASESDGERAFLRSYNTYISGNVNDGLEVTFDTVPFGEIRTLRIFTVEGLTTGAEGYISVYGGGLRFRHSVYVEALRHGIDTYVKEHGFSMEK